MPTAHFRLTVLDQGLVVPWTLVDTRLDLKVEPADGTAPGDLADALAVPYRLDMFRTDAWQVDMIGRGEEAAAGDTLTAAATYVVTTLRAAGLRVDPDSVADQLSALTALVGLGVIPPDQVHGGHFHGNPGR